MSDVIDFSTRAKIHLTPDEMQKEVASVLQELLTEAQQGRIIGLAGGALLADGTSKLFLGGLARADGITGVGLATHSANILSSIMLQSAKQT